MSGSHHLALFDTSPGTVLVVDDDAQVCGLLVALLRPRGYQVETAASAEEAQERLKTLRPDVLLLDLHLPGKSGQDVLARLRADPVTRLLPIIMITGGATGEERLRAIAEGVTDFVAKPFAAEELLARLKPLVRMKRFTDALEHAEHVIVALARAIDARDPGRRAPQARPPHSRRIRRDPPASGRGSRAPVGHEDARLRARCRLRAPREDRRVRLPGRRRGRSHPAHRPRHDDRRHLRRPDVGARLSRGAHARRSHRNHEGGGRPRMVGPQASRFVPGRSRTDSRGRRTRPERHLRAGHTGFPRIAVTFPSMDLRSRGFVRKSTAPVWPAKSTRFFSGNPDMNRTGICAWSGRDFRTRTVSKPSTPGISTSMRMRSTVRVSKNVNASSPDGDGTASNPPRRR